MRKHIIVITLIFFSLILLLTGCESENDEWSFGDIGITLLSANYTGKNTMVLRYRAKEPYYGIEASSEIRGKTQKYRIDRSKGSELYDTWKYKVTWTVVPDWIPGDSITIYCYRSGGSYTSFNVPMEK